MPELFITDTDIDNLEQEFDIELSFDRERRDALRNHDDIQACPGSGKTTLVTAKLILLASKWQDKYRGICVLTHTNVAKEEILGKLQKHPSGHRLLTYPHFIGTIQEFINKFLGNPYAKTKGWNVNQLVGTPLCQYRVGHFTLRN